MALTGRFLLNNNPIEVLMLKLKPLSLDFGRLAEMVCFYFSPLFF
jgi:hypothetical protein